MDRLFISFHIFLAIISQLVAMATTVIALLFLMRQRRLKQRRIEVLAHPRLSLEKIERIFSSMLSVGLILLSCTVSSGFIVHLFLKVNTSHMSLKIIWALLVWLWYFVSFFFKEKYLRSRTVSAQMCSVGCLFLLTAWFGFIF